MGVSNSTVVIVPQKSGRSSNHRTFTISASAGNLDARFRGDDSPFYFIACGLIGEPVPPVMINGGPQKKNS
jgi:hypothetical protein